MLNVSAASSRALRGSTGGNFATPSPCLLPPSLMRSFAAASNSPIIRAAAIAFADGVRCRRCRLAEMTKRIALARATDATITTTSSAPAQIPTDSIVV